MLQRFYQSVIVGVNWKQVFIALKGLLIAGGPASLLLSQFFGYTPGEAEKVIAGASSFVGLVLIIMDKSSTAIIRDAAALPPEKQVAALANIPNEAKLEVVANLPAADQHAALSKVSDTAKILIAEAVPGVATVVTKNDAGNGIDKLAASPDHPNIVTESQNKSDALGGDPKS